MLDHDELEELGIHADYSHEVMQEVKIKLEIDGDVAATIMNVFSFCIDHNFIEGLEFCEHTTTKVADMLEKISTELDIKNRKEI